MFNKSYSIAKLMGCCSCFGFAKPRRTFHPVSGINSRLSEEPLLDDVSEGEVSEGGVSEGEVSEGGVSEGESENHSYDGDATNTGHGDDGELSNRVKRSEEILRLREQSDMICRQFPVKETYKLVRSEDENGNKTINEYVRECKIGAGSYGKVVLYRSRADGKHYAIKAFHKSQLLKLRVAPSETAMTDVLREVLIMKMLDHPNIVNLVEVIDDPETDHFYMVLEYVDGKWNSASGPPVGIGESTARKCLRDIVCGLMYLHAHHIVHGDIKPDNLLVTSSGVVKIGDFSVSQVFEDDNDELRRSPGTPVFTAPECCLGLTYHGKAADTWAVGVTLYCMVLGHYPFLGETLQETYDKIVNNPLDLPDSMNPQLKDLLEGILSKDPEERLTLEAIGAHPWVVGEDGPLPLHQCWCKRTRFQGNGSDGTTEITNDLSLTDKCSVFVC